MNSKLLLLGLIALLATRAVTASPVAEAVRLPRTIGVPTSITGTEDGSVWFLDDGGNLYQVRGATVTLVERAVCSGVHDVQEPNMHGARPVALHSRHGKLYLEASAWKTSAACAFGGFFPVRPGQATHCARGYQIYRANTVLGSDGHDFWTTDSDQTRLSVSGQPVMTPRSDIAGGGFAAPSPFRVYQAGNAAARFNGLDWKVLPPPPFPIHRLAAFEQQLFGIGGPPNAAASGCLESGHQLAKDDFFNRAAWFNGSQWVEVPLPSGVTVSNVAHAGVFWLLGATDWFSFSTGQLERFPAALSDVRSVFGNPAGTLWVAGANPDEKERARGAVVRITLPAAVKVSPVDYAGVNPKSAGVVAETCSTVEETGTYPFDSRFVAFPLYTKPISGLAQGRPGHVFAALKDEGVLDCSDTRCTFLGAPPLPAMRPPWQRWFASLSVTEAGDPLWLGVATNGYDATSAMEGAVSVSYVHRRGGWQSLRELDDVLGSLGNDSLAATRDAPPVVCGVEHCAQFSFGKWRRRDFRCFNRMGNLSRIGEHLVAPSSYPTAEGCGRAPDARSLEVLPEDFTAIEGRSLQDYWYTTRNRLIHVEKGKRTEEFTSPVGEVTSLFVGAPGQVWITGSAGVAHWVDGMLLALDAWQSSAFQVASDGSHLWLSSPQGLSTLRKESPKQGESRFTVKVDIPVAQAGKVEVSPSLLVLKTTARKPQPVAETPPLPNLLFVTKASDGATMGILPGLLSPRFAIRRDSTWTLSPLPNANYRAIASFDEETWFVGSECSASTALVVHRLAGVDHLYRAAEFVPSVIVATGPGLAWVVGDDGQVLYLTPNSTTRYRIPNAPTMRAVAARAPNDVWLVGDETTVLHFNGARLELQPVEGLPIDLALDDVSFDGAGQIVVSGPMGAFAKR